MRCLITGASGYLGSHLARRMLDDGHDVFALVRARSDLWRLQGIISDISLIRGDMMDLGPTAAAIRASAPEATFHLAWSGVAGSCRNDADQVSCNVVGSIRLFEMVRDAGCRCWVGLGSQAEYGPYDIPLDENLPARPATSYGAAKLAVGLLTARLSDAAGMRHVWVRLTSSYGPKDDERHMIPMVIRRMLEGEAPALTPGAQVWDYLYAEDVAEALKDVAVNDGVFGVFNLGSGQGKTIRDIVRSIRDLIDPSLHLSFGAVPYRDDQVMYLKADIRRLQEVTGWHPKTSLEDGLGRTIDWYSNNRDRTRVAARG